MSKEVFLKKGAGSKVGGFVWINLLGERVVGLLNFSLARRLGHLQHVIQRLALPTLATVLSIGLLAKACACFRARRRIRHRNWRQKKRGEE